VVDALTPHAQTVYAGADSMTQSVGRTSLAGHRVMTRHFSLIVGVSPNSWGRVPVRAGAVGPKSRSQIRWWWSITLRSFTVSVAVITLIDLVGLTSRVAWAQDERPEATVPSTEGKAEHQSAGGAVDRAHDMISSQITETADRLDAFLGDERILEESNRSSLKVAVLRITDEHGLEIRTEVHLKIVLPRLQNRLQLVITQDDTVGAIESEDGTGLVEDLAPGSPSGDLTSALRLMLRSARDANIYLDAGVRVRIHPTVFSRIRYRRSVELDQWAVRFTQSVKWEEQFAENPYQWEVISRLDFDRPITPEFFFRTSLQGAWYEGRQGYFVTQGFSLVHRISERRAVAYEWNTSALTGQLVKTENDIEIIVDPDTGLRVKETGLKIRYRQSIGRPWLFVEADAERAFRRDVDLDSDFDGVWRFLVKLEVQFRDMRDTIGDRLR
jgi:hypothetical protein